ncbi:MAG: fimbrillin family protein, partial [Duncaniella sp.]|nr:fimbrillin family protein [Duncaniella sp.]
GHLTYVSPASVADQEDLLVAIPTDASASPCALTFNHALTAIRFVAGSEMAPCTVTSVELRGIKGSGTLDITDGTWSGLSGSETYAVTPGVELKAAAGSDFVLPGTEIAVGENTFILIPQTLGPDASILLTIEQGGAVSTFEAPLEGQTWTAGTTVTYRLSANPSSQQLILEITDEDGNRLSEISTPYTGGTVHFKVVSSYLDGDVVGQVGWKAEFVDASGNILASAPDWIVKFATSGEGDADCEMVADLPEPIFEQMSARTSNLRKAADINTASGHTPYNLSNPTGAPAVVNTANTYIISAPGTYSLPLVYGNAVTDGAKYPASYTSTLSHTTTHTRETLYKFINHLGAEIS